MNKTFKEIGITFELNSACITCLDNSCHNNLISKRDGQEYHVHISTNNSFSEFLISPCGTGLYTQNGWDIDFI